jgi:hypothetical protein
VTASMYDATDPASIPADVPAPGYAMGYVDGDWPSYEAMRARFPAARPVAISAIPGSPTASTAQGCDGELGDYSIYEAAHFSAAKLVVGLVPFVYCSWATWHDYQEAHVAIGIDPARVDWGIAAYPGIGPVLYPGSVFHQFIDHGSYDESVVADGWMAGRPTIDPPDPTMEVPMPVSEAVTFNPGRSDVFQVSFGTLWHKWLTNGAWHNEALTGPFGVAVPARGTTLPDQRPSVAILGNQCIVTVEDTAGRGWYFAQNTGSPDWGVNEMP